MAKKASRAAKPTAAKRSLNLPGSKKAIGAPYNDQNVKHRLGNFSGAGVHPRQGGRTTGIVGQSKQRNHTDKKS